LFDRGQKGTSTRFPGFFKHLQKLIIQSDSGVQYLKSARKNSALKELCVKILETDIPIASKLFRGLFKLENVGLAIANSSKSLNKKSPKSDITWRFLKSLVSLKRLKTLRLLMNDCEITKEVNFFDHLMEVLSENSNIEKLDLILHMQNFEETEPSEKAKKMLSKIEDLHIECVSKAFPFANLAPKENEERKMRRKVTIYLSGGRKIDISKVLTSRFLAVRSLKICYPAELITISPEMRLMFPALELILILINHKESQKVENIVSYLAENLESPQLKHFEIEFNNFTDGILNEFTKLHSSSSLAQIQEYFISTHDTSPWNQVVKNPKGRDIPIDMPSNDAFDNYMESFSKLISLQKFKLSTRVKNALYIKSIEKSFDHLPNLSELELVLIEKNPNAKLGQSEIVFMEMPVYKLVNLQSLKLVYNPTLKIQDFMGLLEKMSKLEELRSLTIESVETDLKDRKRIESIASILSKFPKCKRLSIGPRKVGNSGSEEMFIDAKICEN